LSYLIANTPDRGRRRIASAELRRRVLNRGERLVAAGALPEPMPQVGDELCRIVLALLALGELATEALDLGLQLVDGAGELGGGSLGVLGFIVDRLGRVDRGPTPRANARAYRSSTSARSRRRPRRQ
jgi:hypothetical protein